MTIQQELKADIRIGKLVGFIAWMVMFALLHINPSGYSSEIMLCVLVFFASLLYQEMLITCPRCKASIVKSARKHKPGWLNLDLTYRTVDDACRECGCDFLQDAEAFESDKTKHKNS
ncbi:hypothetical protein ACFODZ_09510 [Marinicella sediminis]|uniref:C2H2-type domain-containing protein n=1 Tax=Marinicella sediminis TaxID=1792834 RepID=A0ABV7JC86_9GAMM|nr:hypothetical protein [Marinicella sediminis]